MKKKIEIPKLRGGHSRRSPKIEVSKTIYNRKTEKAMLSEDWVDPAGGIHSYDEEDPAKMYE